MINNEKHPSGDGPIAAEKPTSGDLRCSATAKHTASQLPGNFGVVRYLGIIGS